MDKKKGLPSPIVLLNFPLEKNHGRTERTLAEPKIAKKSFTPIMMRKSYPKTRKS